MTQAVTLMCGTSLVPTDKSSVQECCVLFCFPGPARAKLPRLCRTSSHAERAAAAQKVFPRPEQGTENWPVSFEKTAFSQRITDDVGFIPEGL